MNKARIILKNLPLEHYKQWPLAERSVAYLQAAKTLYEPRNRVPGFWITAYYCLSHSVELAIKAVAQKGGAAPPRVHDNEELARMCRPACDFSDAEIEAIKRLKELNNGPGGLRYQNEPRGEFLPSTFQDNAQIVERLIAENFQ